MTVPWMRATVAVALHLVIGGGALVAGGGGDDIRCYAPDESACVTLTMAAGSRYGS